MCFTFSKSFNPYIIASRVEIYGDNVRGDIKSQGKFAT